MIDVMNKELQELIEKAEQGDVEAMILVAKHYKVGDIVERDDLKAHKYVLMAAEKGHAEAQCTAGTECCFGLSGVPENMELGLDYLQRSADQDNKNAKYVLAVLYKGNPESGRCLKNRGFDDKKYIRYLEEAAKQGHEGAQEWLENNPIIEEKKSGTSKIKFWIGTIVLIWFIVGMLQLVLEFS